MACLPRRSLLTKPCSLKTLRWLETFGWEAPVADTSSATAAGPTIRICITESRTGSESAHAIRATFSRSCTSLSHLVIIYQRKIAAVQDRERGRLGKERYFGCAQGEGGPVAGIAPRG